MKKNLQYIVCDIVLFVLYLLSANPALTGIQIHEWVSVLLLLIFIAHLVEHTLWFADVKKQVSERKKISKGMLGYLVVAAVTGLTAIVVMVSGVMVSRYVLPSAGLIAQGYFVWSMMHAISAKVLLACIIVHLAIHGKWIAYKLRSLRPQSKKKNPPAA